MGNSQRKKERHTRKRLEKRKKQRELRARRPESQPHSEVALGSSARHRERLLHQVPRAWPGEAPEDVAVFDDAALSGLPPDLATQVSAVREALQEATESRGENALKRVSEIPRSSPLSEWRLFIRGLVPWLADDADAASEAWKRLDPERRPGRIATAMMLALRPDLQQVSPHQEGREPGDESKAAAWSRRDDQLLYHAKLLRRVRFDRAALRIAEAGVSGPEELKTLLLGPKKIHWLRRFVAEYGETEPELATALMQAALRRAYAQNFSDVFELAASSLQGPRHDPRNRLLTFFYFSRCDARDAEARAERALDEYLNRDLPRNEAISATLRGAIASEIHLKEALTWIRPGRGSIQDRLFGPPENPKAIRNHLRVSMKAHPANRAAYTTYVDWIESKVDDDRLTKAERKPFEDELPGVMEAWSQALPEDVEPRLWLVDHLLENERLEAAKPHVEYLAASRHDDPRVRATPWKWQLLEAMRLCRRKAWLPDVPARLDEAERQWPAWLSKQWLPYLRAAWMLRSGQAEAYEEQRQQIVQESGLIRDSLADACMMLGAAQQMRVPAADLKPLRAPVDQHLKKLAAVPLEDLLEAGSFFWDLHRVQLVYPSYRMHGAKLGRELLDRLSKVPRASLNNERFHSAMLWCSEYRFWPANYSMKLPVCFSHPSLLRHPMIVGARLNAYLKGRYYWDFENYLEFGPLLREAARSQRDAYYGHWFAALADRFDDVASSKRPAPFGGFFGRMFGDESEDPFELETDIDLDFDPDCDCPECKAAKRAAEQARSSK